MENIRTYIASDSESYADRFLARLIQSVDHIAEFPLSGRIVPESAVENIREIIVGNYRVIYRVDPDKLVVLTVIHGARNISEGLSSQ